MSSVAINACPNVVAISELLPDPSVAARNGYTTPTNQIATVTPAGTATRDFAYIREAIVTGRIRDDAGTPLADVTIELGGHSATTNADGVFSLVLNAGTYTLTPPARADHVAPSNALTGP